MKQSDKISDNSGSPSIIPKKVSSEGQTISESSETPLSTAPTSPISSSSYKSGTLTDDTNVAQALQVVGANEGDPEPQISERAAYGEQMVRKF